MIQEEYNMMYFSIFLILSGIRNASDFKKKLVSEGNRKVIHNLIKGNCDTIEVIISDDDDRLTRNEKSLSPSHFHGSLGGLEESIRKCHAHTRTRQRQKPGSSDSMISNDLLWKSVS